MPYRRRPVYRKKKRSRFTNYKHGGQQLYKDVMYIKSLVNSELHYDYSSYSTTIDTTGQMFHLSAISQGDGISNRSGNSVLPRYLQVQFILLNTTTSIFDTVRVMIFRWKDNSTPTVAQVFEDSSNPVYSPLNDNISGNIRDRQIDVIKNKVFVVGDQCINNGGTYYKKQFDLNPPNKNIKDHIKFNDTATTDEVGGIYMLMIGTQSVNTTNLRGMHKLSFHDN